MVCLTPSINSDGQPSDLNIAQSSRPLHFDLPVQCACSCCRSTIDCEPSVWYSPPQVQSIITSSCRSSVDSLPWCSVQSNHGSGCQRVGKSSAQSQAEQSVHFEWMEIRCQALTLHQWDSVWCLFRVNPWSSGGSKESRLPSTAWFTST